jgi:hypothetical protein
MSIISPSAKKKEKKKKKVEWRRGVEWSLGDSKLESSLDWTYE